MQGLRPYQISFVNQILASLQRGENPIGVLPTGAGKTQCFTAVIGNRLQDGWEQCVFVHRVELLHQASARLTSAGIPHGIIAPGFNLSSHKVHVASIDTVAARLAELLPWLRRLRLGIIDEAHHSVAASWEKILRQLQQRLGVTATPGRLDGKGLGDTGLFNRMIMGPSIKQLTGMGFLAPARVYAPPNGLDLSAVSKSGGDYVLKKIAELVDTPEFTNIALLWYAHMCPGQPCVIFCTTIAHAENVAAAFRAAGWRAKSVDGTMGHRERADAIGGLETGEVQVLTSCSLISEGTDIPSVSAAIMLRPTASTPLDQQQKGRVIRPHEDKSHATILDPVGNTLVHGYYSADRHWSLDGGLEGIERAVASTWRCRKCYAVHENTGTGKTCYCGAFQQPSSMTSAAIAGHHPIAGVPVHKLLEMRFVDAVQVLNTRQELVQFGKAKGLEHPLRWAKSVLEQRERG